VPNDSVSWKDRLKAGDRVELNDGTTGTVTAVNWGGDGRVRQVKSVTIRGRSGNFGRKALKRKVS
jgi:hypothetical protein